MKIGQKRNRGDVDEELVSAIGTCFDDWVSEVDGRKAMVKFVCHILRCENSETFTEAWKVFNERERKIPDLAKWTINVLLLDKDASENVTRMMDSSTNMIATIAMFGNLTIHHSSLPEDSQHSQLKTYCEECLQHKDTIDVLETLLTYYVSCETKTEYDQICYTMQKYLPGKITSDIKQTLLSWVTNVNPMFKLLKLLFEQ